MTTLKEVAMVQDISPGTMKGVVVGELRIAVCNVEGVFYAVEDVCSHDDGPLGEGRLRGKEAECPRHGARFDVTTGVATRMPAVIPIRTFPVRVQDGKVFIEV